MLPSDTCASSVVVASVTDEFAIKEAASASGTWDVLIMNAGYISPGYISTSNLVSYWQNYEVSVLPRGMDFWLSLSLISCCSRPM